MNINLSRVHFPVATLGPGQRVGIWFQGCSLKCDGCISVDTWAHGHGQTTIAELLNIIQPFFATADGITISGGEPFEQFEELKALLAQLRSAFAGDILVYSGFERDSIEGSLSELNGLIDALITGPFKQEEPQTLPWRGSDNQVLHKLTELGEQRYENGDDPACANFKSLDIMFDDDSTIWMAGIPQRGDIKRLLVLLNQDGIRASSTEALGAPT